MVERLPSLLWFISCVVFVLVFSFDFCVLLSNKKSSTTRKFMHARTLDVFIDGSVHTLIPRVTGLRWLSNRLVYSNLVVSRTMDSPSASRHTIFIKAWCHSPFWKPKTSMKTSKDRVGPEVNQAHLTLYFLKF